MFIGELELPHFDSFDLSSLRTGVMAGSTCPEQVMRNVIDRMHMSGVSIAYGMTETSPMSTQTRPTDSLTRRVTTVGRVVAHTEVQVIDPETGAQVERGTPGELCTRGYCVMAGYWNNPEQTAEAIDGDGWMHTGDIAVMDDDGYLAITGRIAHNKIPRYVQVIDEFPMTVTGKIRKVELRERGEALLDDQN
jgi:fatty-acyl-CoA synthase